MSEQKGGGGGRGGHGGGNKRPRVANQHNSLSKFQQSDTQSMDRRMNERLARLRKEDDLDAEYGYDRLGAGPGKTGFIFNLRQSFIQEEETGKDLSVVECYLVQEDGHTFKASLLFHPYFLVAVNPGQSMTEIEEWLARRFEGLVLAVEQILKEDLGLPNHLSGLKQPYLKLVFRNTTDLMTVRRVILPAVQENRRRRLTNAYTVDEGMFAGPGADVQMSGMASGNDVLGDKRKRTEKVLDSFIDIREYDVAYTQRVQIDTGLRVGLWYDVQSEQGKDTCSFKPRSDLVGRPLMKVLAFDIETSKSPLKFPNAEVDPIMMISLMMDGQGLLIVNREIVSQDISPFEYTPKPEYEGPFDVINCKNEKDTLREFISYVKKTRPLVFVTFNGDYFDWPYIDKRAAQYGMSLESEMGMTYDDVNAEFKGRFTVHLDAFYWVKRDSYLPQGSHGLKAVTKAKLKYDPVELDPEDMLPFAIERPQLLASYSVSDAVATYYLYLKYVHLFIFSLCTIIPMPPSDVLRKGSGTLCEMLLMVKAFESNVVAPNKEVEELQKFFKGHLLESETYIGGHVECLESGVFRSDIPVKFDLNSTRLQQLIDSVDHVLKFCIVEENNATLESVRNYDQVRQDIVSKLTDLRDKPTREHLPLIYHLDVGAMYPNIILTNRLQPYSVVDAATCAACDFNDPSNNCQRKMHWSWRGKYYVASHADYAGVKASLNHEALSKSDIEKHNVDSFSDLKEEEQAARIKERVKLYCRRVYKKLTEEKIEEKEAVICQREHPFYVDTVRSFRDRRYEYKALNKQWGRKLAESKDALTTAQCRDMILLYDSMQLAHKCILNSFYGYVMRKGARWHSMEMAGVVTQTGARIIQDATDLVMAVGRPLELDTDGIWCVLPSIFPENYVFESVDAKGNVKKINMSYPCSILNAGVNVKFANPQYQTLVNPETLEYKTTRECTIYFEVDGPYRAMVLPASQHEGKNIKKRYAVFNKDGSLAELKGFEIKRRGELKLIKIFQGEVFKTFLLGDSLADCYRHVGTVADRWLDVLYSKGADLEDDDVFDLISENKSMSEELASYGEARSTSITTAKRLGEFLGAEMVKDKGLNCKFVIARLPQGAPVSDRAIPVAIFAAERAVKSHFLRKWLGDSSLSSFDIRDLLDWDYYITRLGSAIQKIVTIPAAFQHVHNPVPRVVHPDWLAKALRIKHDTAKQTSLTSFFKGSTGSKSKQGESESEEKKEVDMEDAFAMPKDPGSTLHMKKRAKVLLIKPPRPTAGTGTAVSGDSLGDEGQDGESGWGEGEFLEREDDDDDAEEVNDMLGGESGRPEGSDVEEVEEKGKSTRRQKKTSGFLIDSDIFAQDDDGSDDGSVGGKGSAKKTAKGKGKGGKGGKNQGDEMDSFGNHQSLINQPMPDIRNEFKAWLAWQQAMWREERNKRAAQRRALYGQAMPASGASGGRSGKRGAGSSSGGGSGTEVSLRGFMGDESRVSTHWQIIRIEPIARSHGIFDVWVLVGGVLRLVTLEVPRIIYLNTLTKNAVGEAMGKPVERVLPRGRPCLNLYQLTLAEEEYVARRNEFLDLVNLPAVEGLYEAHVPLLFNAIVRSGCVCLPQRRPGREAEERRLQFHIDDLTRCSPFEAPYLPSNEPLQRIYMYHAHSDSRHIYGVFTVNMDNKPDDSSEGEEMDNEDGNHDTKSSRGNTRFGSVTGTVIIVGRTADRVNYRAEYIAQCQRFNFPQPNSSTPAIAATSFNVEQHVVATHQQGIDLLRDALLSLKSSSMSPSLVLAQSISSSEILRAHIPALFSEFPVVRIPWHTDDALEVMQWVPKAVTRMFSRFIESHRWWDEHVSLARHSSVPIGNLSETQTPHHLQTSSSSAAGGSNGGSIDGSLAAVTGASTSDASSPDVQVQCLDVTFARALRDANHLLWIGRSGEVDLGGVTEEMDYFEDELTNPEISLQGCFRAVTVEIHLRLLATNAIVNHAHLADAEAAGSDALDSALQAGTLGEALGGSQATLVTFEILKRVVSTLLESVIKEQNEDSDVLLMHMYRWLRSPRSRLYDPALFVTVHRLMKKVFMQFVTALRRLGCVVVYASFTKVIICTDKPTLPRGINFTTYVINTVSKRPLFSRLSIVPTQIWHTFAFLDSANFGGIIANTDDGANTTGPDGISHDAQTEVISNWNIAAFLPEKAQESFEVIISDFIILPHDHMATILKRGDGAAQTTKEREDAMAAYLRNLVETTFQRRLLGLVSDLNSLYPPDSTLPEGAFSPIFPDLPGRHLQMRSAALEFAKATMHIISLDPLVSDSAAKVKANLLHKLGVKPFSQIANFRNPCMTFILPDVFCNFCHQAKDLDLCRDPDLEVDDQGNARWKCYICQNPYDNAEIESSLIHILHRRSTYYQVQDLFCAKCHDIKVSNVVYDCPCSGQYKNAKSPESHRDQLTVLLGVARTYGFEALEEEVKWVLYNS